MNYYFYCKPIRVHARCIRNTFAVKKPFFILLLLVLSSCAHNRLHFVKSKHHPATSEHVVEKKDRTADRPIVLDLDEAHESTNVAPVSSEDVRTVSSTQDFEAPTLEDSRDITTPPNDSDTIRTDSDTYKLMIAEAAEKDARNSRSLFLTSIVLFFIPLTTVFSWIPFLFGLILLSRSNKAQYITLAGENISRKARIARNGYIILMGLVILLVAFILIVFAL